MIEEIEKILKESPGLKGKEIAKKIGAPKKDVNSFLYAHLEKFVRDDEFCWSLVKARELIIRLEADTWVDGASFDRSIQNTASPLETDYDSILFVIPEGCKIFLEAMARLLALCNQLGFAGKTVTIDFSACKAALNYFDRIGFLSYLDGKVIVLPNRPEVSRSSLYKGNSDAVVELGEIDPEYLDESIPKQLKNSFVAHAGEKYSQPAFTVISELFGNVRDHSEERITGQP